MDNFDLVIIMSFMCIVTFIGILLIVDYFFIDKVGNLEIEIAFMKLDLSCEKSPRENIISNYLTTPRQDVLINKINDWYLQDCLN